MSLTDTEIGVVECDLNSPQYGHHLKNESTLQSKSKLKQKKIGKATQ